jgi:hypothetical protein
MGFITALSVLRMISGASFFALPGFTAQKFGLPYTGHVAIVARMIGARDFAMGALLYTSPLQTSNTRASNTMEGFSHLSVSDNPC